MKRSLTFIFLMMILSTVALANHFWFGKQMSIREAVKRWGNKPFSVETFSKADYHGKAKMAADLVRNKRKWVGKSLQEVRSKLGGHDGYYFTDFIPAYIIEEGQREKEDTWQVVFLPTSDRKVADIIIHRNCCD